MQGHAAPAAGDRFAAVCATGRCGSPAGAILAQEPGRVPGQGLHLDDRRPAFRQQLPAEGHGDELAETPRRGTPANGRVSALAPAPSGNPMPLRPRGRRPSPRRVRAPDARRPASSSPRTPVRGSMVFIRCMPQPMCAPTYTSRRGEGLASHVRPSGEDALQRVDYRLQRAVAGRTAPARPGPRNPRLWFRVAASSGPAGKEQPAVVRPAGVRRRRQAGFGKRIRQVRANRRRLGDDDVTVLDSRDPCPSG